MRWQGAPWASCPPWAAGGSGRQPVPAGPPLRAVLRQASSALGKDSSVFLKSAIREDSFIGKEGSVRIGWLGQTLTQCTTRFGGGSHALGDVAMQVQAAAMMQTQDPQCQTPSLALRNEAKRSHTQGFMRLIPACQAGHQQERAHSWSCLQGSRPRSWCACG